MEEKQLFFELLQSEQRRRDLALLAACNETTAGFGLTLSPEEAGELIRRRDESLKKYGRVEFDGGILDRLVYAFCDSPYLNQDNNSEMLGQLQDIFYEFKNETEGQMTDEELLNFMREQFDEVCFGDAGYLEDTCLNRFAAGVRAGYRTYHASDGRQSYEPFSEEARWDSELYLVALRELCWR